MAIPAKLKQQIESELNASVQKVDRVSGGDIATTVTVKTDTGQAYFLKFGEDLAPDLFTAEATGLKTIAAAACIRTPAVIAVSEAYLILELIAETRPKDHYWTELGHQLAQLHGHTAEYFGFEHDNYCGATPQSNHQDDDGYRFFAIQRLNSQAEMACKKGLLTIEDVRLIEQIGIRLPEIIPPQPPSLLHGDLWSGNQLCDEHQQPVLIDPACYYGWAEAEIAMTRLFGGFDERFYQAYLGINPLEPGWQQRCGIYNLYHLLNHLNLFGPSYYTQVRATIHQYR